MQNFPSEDSLHDMEMLQKPTRGILKNSNPYASYHKYSDLRRQLDDLIESELPMSSSSASNMEAEIDYDVELHGDKISSCRHHRHGHHHSHKSKHKGSRRSKRSDDASEVVKVDGQGRCHKKSTCSKHRRHHHKSIKHKSQEKEILLESTSNISETECLHYDLTRIPPLPVSEPPCGSLNKELLENYSSDIEWNFATSIETLDKEESFGCSYGNEDSLPHDFDNPDSCQQKIVVYENIAFKEADLDEPSEKIELETDDLEQESINQNEDPLFAINPNKELNVDTISVDETYKDFVEAKDSIIQSVLVPETRDSLSTIEEEHTECDTNILNAPINLKRNSKILPFEEAKEESSSMTKIEDENNRKESCSNEDEIKVESEGPESLRIDEIGILDEILFAKVNYKTQLSVTHKKETLLDSGEKHDFKYRIQSGDRKQFIMDHILGVKSENVTKDGIYDLEKKKLFISPDSIDDQPAKNEMFKDSTRDLMKKFELRSKCNPLAQTNLGDRHLDIYNETLRQRANRQTKSFEAPDCNEEPLKAKGSEEEVLTIDVENTKHTAKDQMKLVHPPSKRSTSLGIADIDDINLPSVRQLRGKFEIHRTLEPDFRQKFARVKQRSPASNQTVKKEFPVESQLNENNFTGDSIKSPSSESKKIHDELIFIDSSKNLKVQQNSVQTEEKPKDSGQTIDDRTEKRSMMANFNTIDLIKQMYKLQGVNESAEKNTSSEDLLEGYLDRLPPCKKKSTVWKSWKRQYFVAKNGLLFVYVDDSREVFIERIELFGGRVDFVESLMLGIQDRRGHYIVIKCEDEKIAEKWQKSLSKHTIQDFSQTFVTPKDLPKSPDLFTRILIVDIGGASVRAGIASTLGPTLPQLFFPTVMATAKSGNDQPKYFGLDAFSSETRASCNLSLPFTPSEKIDKMSIDLVALRGIFKKIFGDLGIDPTTFEIQFSAPRPLGEHLKKQIYNLFFGEFRVKSLNLAHQTVFALNSYNARTGIIVDLGERMEVVPVIDGYKVSSGVSNLSVGGSQMRQKLQHFLQGRNVSLNSFLDEYLLRHILESSIFISRQFEKDLEKYRENPRKFNQQINLDKTVSITMGSERFEIGEGLFKPELWGLDQAGIHVLVHKAICECSVDDRKHMTQNIFLTGGLTLIPGFKERLEAELEKLTPCKPRVHVSPFRYHAAYLGACSHASSDEYQLSKMKLDAWLD